MEQKKKEVPDFLNAFYEECTAEGKEQMKQFARKYEEQRQNYMSRHM